MNIYDKKQVNCSVCEQFIGEINQNANVAYPLCAKCTKQQNTIFQVGIKKILVPLDGSLKSTRALNNAIFFAKRFGAKITILYVIPNIPYVVTSIPHGSKGVLEKFQTGLKKEAVKIIQIANVYCLERGVPVYSKSLFGDEEKAILKTIKSGKYDLVIMGSSGKGIVKEAVFGSISSYVLRNSTVPVLIVKESSKKIKIKPNKKQIKQTTTI